MENSNTTKHRRLAFYGDGSKLFGITIVNAIFSVLTLGFYYPWAKVAKLRYLYHEAEFEGSRFEFHGKGKEVFRGFLKALAIIIVFYVLIAAGTFTHNWKINAVCVFFAYTIMTFLIPLAIHGSARYRLSRTSWRGIHFGYRGNRNELIKLYIKYTLLYFVTLGIYGSWFSINLRKYVIGHIRFGNVSFSYTGNGSDFFWLRVESIFFCIITLGIYIPWFIKELTNYYIDNIKLHQDGKYIQLKSSLSGAGYFKLFAVNFLIVLFSLGIATPWAIIRTMRYLVSNVSVVGDLDTENILQTEEDYKNATGDDLADMLDLDIL